MIQESYCSFEVAKLLKEKGFDEPCRAYFINDLDDYIRCAVEITNKNCSNNQILMPTHQMAMAWLREEHNIFIIIEPRSHIAKTSTYMFGMWIKSTYEQHFERFFSYEEAVEAALKYALKNLI